MNETKYRQVIHDYCYRLQVTMLDESSYSDFEINGLSKALADDFIKKYNEISEQKIEAADINDLIDSLSDEEKEDITAAASYDVRNKKAPVFVKMGTRWIV